MGSSSRLGAASRGRAAAIARVPMVGLLLALTCAPSGAAEHRLDAGQPIQPVLDAAAPGDVIRLAPGRHAGPLLIERALALVGEPGAVLAGPGEGSVITVMVPDVRVEGLEITGSGTDL